MRFSRRSLSLLLLLALVGLGSGTLIAAAPHRHRAHSPSLLLARLTSPSRLTPPPHRLPGATGLTTFGGTITSASGAASSVVCPSADQASVACQVTGTWVATLVFQATVDGVNWVAVHANATTTDTLVTGPAANGLFILACSGFTGVRLHATAYTSGTAVVTFGAGPGSSAIMSVSAAGGTGSGAVTLTDGADTTEGVTTDAAVQGDNPGTVSAKLRGLNKSVAAGVPVTGTVTANAGTGTLTTAGAKTHNAAVPGATNVGALGGLANAASPTFTEGDQVLFSTDLSGNTRMAPLHLAVAHGSNPTTVTAGSYAYPPSNRAGIPFYIGGHPNIITVRANYAAAQTNTVVVANTAGTKLIITGFMLTESNANTVNVSAVLGLAQTVTPTTTGVIGAHPGIAAGSGFGRGNGAGIIGIGADGDQILLTTGAPTSGSEDLVVSYFSSPS